MSNRVLVCRLSHTFGEEVAPERGAYLVHHIHDQVVEAYSINAARRLQFYSQTHLTTRSRGEPASMRAMRVPFWVWNECLTSNDVFWGQAGGLFPPINDELRTLTMTRCAEHELVQNHAKPGQA